MSPESKQIPLKPNATHKALHEAARLKEAEYYRKVCEALDRRFACIDPGRVIFCDGKPVQNTTCTK